MRNYVLENMEDGLRALQTVKTLDYDAAYRAAFGGGHVLDPAHSESAAEWFQGRCQALSLVTRQWDQYMRERAEREAAFAEREEAA